jgi:hypothetical protein
MNRLMFAGLCAATTVAVGAAVAAQQLPDAPAKGFGTSITGAYEGWYDNPDGTHTFLIGYYNRNIKRAMDIPVSRTTTLISGRHGTTDAFSARARRASSVLPSRNPLRRIKLTWTIVANGEPMTIPLRMNVDYNVSPFSGLEIGNTPPSLHF